MNRETTSFTLSSGDQATLELVEQNHNTYCVIPTITLLAPVIPYTLFQQSIDHIATLTYLNIEKIYFNYITINYRIITIHLLGHVRAALKKELTTPTRWNKLINKEDDYNWLEPDFFPKFPSGIDDDLNYLEKIPNKLYQVLKIGSFNGVPYELPKTYHVYYNYYFDLHPTDIVPNVDVFIKTSPPISNADINSLTTVLQSKFDSFDVKITFDS